MIHQINIQSHKHIILLLFLLFSIGCTKDSKKIQGEYRGTFQRDQVITSVRISLEDFQFSGYSEGDDSPNNYVAPVICSGDFTVDGTQIDFQNMCLFTADFDWTLILDGSWEYSFDHQVLNLSKANGDTYILIKQ